MKRISILFLLVFFSCSSPVLAARQQTTWPAWGNNTIADCTFAAAANWEIATLGYTPSETRIENEYLEASGHEDGLTLTQFTHWWFRHGIAGVHAKMREVSGENALYSPGTLPSSASNRLRGLLGKYHYLLARVGWDLGHEILLNGYTEVGPTYISWGEERQMTWLEWQEDGWGVFIVAVS